MGGGATEWVSWVGLTADMPPLEREKRQYSEE